MQASRSRVHAAVASLLGAALLPAAGCAPRPDAAPHPVAGRIVLVSLDTLRADALADPESEGLPRVARLAAEGARFTRAWAAASYTLPAHAAMLTGRDPAEHPLAGERPRLAADIPTLAELLQRAGFTTWGLHEGGYLRPRYGFDRGFDVYRQLPRGAFIGTGLDAVLDFLSEHRDERFFLFLHTYAAHDPWGGWEALRRSHPELGLPSRAAVRELAASYPRGTPPERIPPAHRHLFQLFNALADQRSDRVDAVARRPVEELADAPHFELALAAMRRGYRERVHRIDAALGRLRERLEQLGLWEDTLLVVTSDHGEAFFEHGEVWHGFVPYEEVLRVPLLVSFPRLLRGVAPLVSDAPVWQLDLVPTLLSLAGLPPEPALPGADLTPLLLGRAGPPADRGLFPLVSEVEFLPPEPPQRVAIREGFKLVPQHPRFHADSEQLFDLERDPGETRNLDAQRSAERDELAAARRAWEQGLTPAAPSTDAPARSPQDLEELRQLGYAE